ALLRQLIRTWIPPSQKSSGPTSGDNAETQQCNYTGGVPGTIPQAGGGVGATRSPSTGCEGTSTHGAWQDSRPPTNTTNPEERRVKFRVERDVFADAVAWAARSLPVRPSAPVLAGLLIEAGE